MTRIKIDYGIDLGTTNSAICRMESGTPIIKKTDVQKDTMESCVSFSSKKVIQVGAKAINTYRKEALRSTGKTKDDSNSFIEFKRTMGTDKKFYSSNMDKEFTSEELSAEVLKKLKSFITDDNFSSAVVTVPAKFNTSQIDATQVASELAGFNHVELLQEPIAASMAYGLNPEKSDGNWLVFDFGGGTFDVALINVEDGIMKVTDSEGDNYLGGKDLDYAIVDNILMPYLKKEYQIDKFLENQSNLDSLRDGVKQYAEEAKIQLSFNDSFNLVSDIGDIQIEGNDIEIDLVLSNKDLKECLEPVFQKAIDLTIELLNRNNLKESSIGTVLLVGGPTYSPILREMLKSKISKNVNTSIDPMTAVASGAALYASTRDIPEQHQKRDLTKIQLELKYESTSVEDEEFITVIIAREKTDGEVPKEVLVEISRSDGGWSSGQVKLENDRDVLEVSLEEGKANNFKISVFDDKGNNYECEPSEINIIQGSKVGDSTLPMNIGIEIKDISSGKAVFKTIPGLEKNKSLPAVGKTNPLKTQKQIRPGKKEDIIKIPIYEGEHGADGSKAIYNSYIKDVIITGVDISKLLPAGSEVEITIKIDSSRKQIFEAYIPYLDESIDLEIEREIKTVISSQKLEEEVSSAQNQLQIVSEDSDSNETEKLETELNEVKSLLDNGKDDDTREKAQQMLLKTLKKIDKQEELAEWPNTEEELNDVLKLLKENNENYGDDPKLTEFVNQLFKMSEEIISKKDTKTAKDLIEQIRALNFRLVDEGAGVALDIAIIKQMDDLFDTHDWSDKSQARKLINDAKEIIGTNPKKETLRPIILKLWDLQPNIDSGKGLTDDTILSE
jgi:molecular chaperone DnaK